MKLFIARVVARLLLPVVGRVLDTLHRVETWAIIKLNEVAK